MTALWRGHELRINHVLKAEIKSFAVNNVNVNVVKHVNTSYRCFTFDTLTALNTEVCAVWEANVNVS